MGGGEADGGVLNALRSLRSCSTVPWRQDRGEAASVLCQFFLELFLFVFEFFIEFGLIFGLLIQPAYVR